MVIPTRVNFGMAWISLLYLDAMYKLYVTNVRMNQCEGCSTSSGMMGLSLLAYQSNKKADGSKIGKTNFRNTQGIVSFKRCPVEVVNFLSSFGVSLCGSLWLEAKLVCFTFWSSKMGLWWGCCLESDWSCCNGWRTWRMPLLYLAVMLVVLQFDRISNSLLKRCIMCLLLFFNARSPLILNFLFEDTWTLICSLLKPTVVLNFELVTPQN